MPTLEYYYNTHGTLVQGMRSIKVSELTDIRTGGRSNKQPTAAVTLSSGSIRWPVGMIQCKQILNVRTTASNRYRRCICLNTASCILMYDSTTVSITMAVHCCRPIA